MSGFRSFIKRIDKLFGIETPIKSKEDTTATDLNNDILFHCYDLSCPWFDIGGCGNDKEECTRTTSEL